MSRSQVSEKDAETKETHDVSSVNRKRLHIYERSKPQSVICAVGLTDTMKSDAFDAAASEEEDEESEEVDEHDGKKVAGAVNSWQRKKRAAWATPRPPRTEMYLYCMR